jgi:DNA replication protein DnaC
LALTIILDEWLLVKTTNTETRNLLKIIHARHHKASTIFCSHFAPMGWYNRFPEGQIADTLLDRIVHDSYLIEIPYIDKEHDKSMHEVYGIKEDS